MKRICAWCGLCIGFKCPECGEPLRKAKYKGHFLLMCDSGLSKIYFLNLAAMGTTSTICNSCLVKAGKTPRPSGQDTLTDEDRLNLAAFLQNTTPPQKKGSHGGATEANTTQSKTTGKETP